ncbi:MAG TPA: choice-of-anchor Q domain-containing protein, partial [Solirubrobacteraceae bacterium]
APNCTGTDQRNIARPQGAGCDIGAYEMFQPVEGKQFSEVVGAASPREGTTPTINWGDGTQPSSGTLDANTRQLSGTHTYAEEGLYQASFTYINSDGFPETHPFDVKVQDAPLTASGVSVDATVGVSFTGQLATFTDADPNGEVSDYTATINWGDGSTSPGTINDVPSGGFNVTGSHTYASVGVYQTTVTITDLGGSTATAAGTANVVALPTAPPTLLPGSPPSVMTTTSASFTTTVNPHGLTTSVHFEYGPVLGEAHAAAITYGSSTPDQSVGSDFSEHTVTTAVTGLLPNVTYHVRAVASNSAGSTQGADQTFKTPADPPPPPPVLGKTANVEPVSGEVFIKLPPGGHISSVTPFWPAVESLSKGVGFIPLTEARQIPLGSTLDTTAGVARITTATSASKHKKLQFGDFGAGLFKLLQNRKQHGLTQLNMIDVNSSRQVCASTGKARIAAKHLSSKVLGQLNASAHGKFTTHGQYSAATVRGTIWSVANRCDGTLTKVKRGALTVRDFHLRKTITLFTGHSYLAKAPF